MPSTTSAFTQKMTNVLKPLARAESTRAVKAAVRYLEPELVRDGKSRFRVLGAELSVTRPKDRTVIPKRQVEVLVVDYLNRRHVRVVVERGRVVEVRTLDYQPAIHDEEVTEATELAATVPELRKFARRKGVFVSPYTFSRCEPGERRFGLYYLSPGRDGLAEILASVEVDLVEERVLEVHLSG